MGTSASPAHWTNCQTRQGLCRLPSSPVCRHPWTRCSSPRMRLWVMLRFSDRITSSEGCEEKESPGWYTSIHFGLKVNYWVFGSLPISKLSKCLETQTKQKQKLICPFTSSFQIWGYEHPQIWQMFEADKCLKHLPPTRVVIWSLETKHSKSGNYISLLFPQFIVVVVQKSCDRHLTYNFWKGHTEPSQKASMGRHTILATSYGT